MSIYMWRERPGYLCFTANTAGSTVQLDKASSPTAVTLETSTDGNSWSTYTFWSWITLSNIWDKVYMRSTSTTDTGFSVGSGGFYYFAMTGSISASGDITTLLNKNGTTTLSNYCFFHLFDWCTSLTTAPSLPATTLADYCYHYMFNWCTSLATAPSLPATTLAEHCYRNMFNWCTSLTTAPSLPATTLTSHCYYSMFIWCTGLITAPSLPATTLAERCYNSMFSWCTSLTTLPELPATTLTERCYYRMFYNCTNLKLSTTQTWEYQTSYRIPTTWTWTTASNALSDMFIGTWWTFAAEPTINTTYYTSNTLV